MYTYTHFCGHFLWPNPNGSGRKYEEIHFLATLKTNIGQTARLHTITIDKKQKITIYAVYGLKNLFVERYKRIIGFRLFWMIC